ncbi:hypothetical protein VTK56DRAFT_4985 [Thermocarpiscus australiensis]
MELKGLQKPSQRHGVCQSRSVAAQGSRAGTLKSQFPVLPVTGAGFRFRDIGVTKGTYGLRTNCRYCTTLSPI